MELFFVPYLEYTVNRIGCCKGRKVYLNVMYTSLSEGLEQRLLSWQVMVCGLIKN